MNILNYNYGDNLEECIETLRKGKLVVYPTDTLYGIAADINNVYAIKEVYLTKKRSFDKAISVCFHDMEQLDEYVIMSDKIRNIIDKVLPGSYTFLLKKNDNINSLLTSKTSVVGVRIPNNSVSHELTREFPITSTSANISNCPVANNIFEIQKQLGDNVEIYINGGTLDNNLPSTIIDLTRNKPFIVRKGMCDENFLNKIKNINLN